MGNFCHESMIRKSAAAAAAAVELPSSSDPPKKSHTSHGSIRNRISRSVAWFEFQSSVPPRTTPHTSSLGSIENSISYPFSCVDLPSSDLPPSDSNESIRKKLRRSFFKVMRKKVVTQNFDVKSLEREVKGLQIQGICFSLRLIKDATKDFSFKIGEGGYGSVYKGILPSGLKIAVKQLSLNSAQGNREFINEATILTSLGHRHIVRLMGYCIEAKQASLIYEFMEKESLDRALFNSPESQVRLDWPTRCRICLGVAKGLAFLHDEAPRKIIHGDIKLANVLLDKDMNAKIADFGFARLCNEGEDTYITNRIAGTTGYMAPEYEMHGHVTDKIDVYSFGVLTLELLSGRGNYCFNLEDEYMNYCEMVEKFKQKGNLVELVDPKLGSNFEVEQATRLLDLAVSCVDESPAFRPTMSEVVDILKGNKTIKSNVRTRTAFSNNASIEDSEETEDLFMDCDPDIIYHGNNEDSGETEDIFVDCDPDIADHISEDNGETEDIFVDCDPDIADHVEKGSSSCNRTSHSWPTWPCPNGCGPCIIKKTSSQSNLGRYYYCCRGDLRGNDCHNFIKWCDECDRGLDESQTLETNRAYQQNKQFENKVNHLGLLLYICIILLVIQLVIIIVRL